MRLMILASIPASGPVRLHLLAELGRKKRLPGKLISG